jgi:lambda family phage portal protein
LGYKVADANRTIISGWNVGAGNSDIDDLFSLDSLRAISREAYRTQPIAKAIVDTWTSNVVGKGLKYHATPNYDFLKMNGVSDAEIEEFVFLAEFYFELLASTPLFDFTRNENFYEMQNTAFRSMYLSGDIGFSIQQKEKKGFPFSTTVRLYEADRICNPYDAEDTEEVAGGVEVKNGEVVAYHLAEDRHPNGMEMPTKWVKIKAFDDNGFQNFGLVFQSLRPEQRRGIPALATALEALRTLDEYTDLELAGARSSASLLFAFKKEEASEDSENEGIPQFDTAPGSVVGLYGDESIEAISSNRPNPNYGTFFEAIIKQTSASQNIPFEIVMKRFEASYSATRGAIVEFRKAKNEKKSHLVRSFCNPILENAIAEFVAIGALKAKGFFENPLMRKAWLQCDWVGEPQGVINPNQEVTAYAKMVENGWVTNERVAQELAEVSFSQNMRRIKKEQEQLVDAGLKVKPVENGGK